MNVVPIPRLCRLLVPVPMAAIPAARPPAPSMALSIITLTLMLTIPSGPIRPVVTTTTAIRRRPVPTPLRAAPVTPAIRRAVAQVVEYMATEPSAISPAAALGTPAVVCPPYLVIGDKRVSVTSTRAAGRSCITARGPVVTVAVCSNYGTLKAAGFPSTLPRKKYKIWWIDLAERTSARVYT